MQRPTRAVDNTARKIARTQIRKKLGQRLSDLTAGTSAQQLAREWGIGAGTVQKLLDGESDPCLSTAFMIVKGLGLRSVDELIAPSGTTLVLAAVTLGDGEDTDEGRGSKSK